MQRYRLALRDVWNSCFWVDPKLRTWDSVYSFRSLKLPLFNALIGDPLGLEPSDKIFGPKFKIVPNMPEGLPLLEVNTWVPSSASSGIWEPLQGSFKAEDLNLTLVDLFDWSPLDYIDFRYYVVLVESFGTHPDKVGQHALVDVTLVDVLWTGEGDALLNPRE